MFEEIKTESFNERELRILQVWQENKIFEASVKARENSTPFTFYDGPPFATGLPHYGHLLAGTIKDVILRYKTMKDYFVPRRFGWDCHGLPVENEIEKNFQLSGAVSIEEFGIPRFNEECRKIVLRYTEEWKTVVNRMGRWVDFNKTYRTMDPSFMESVWWVFKQLYEKGLVYEGDKVVPYSAKLGTPLSNFEAGENYKEIDDPALTVAFTLKEDPKTAFLAWTTTPWTLISNLALMVGPNIEYVKVKEVQTNRQYILAKSCLKSYESENRTFIILESYLGKDLANQSYIPLFPYFAHRASERAFRVLLEDSVSLEEGTGIVHTAPAFGEIDFYACQRAQIALVCPVDKNGLFTQEIPEYAGQFVKDTDKAIARRLKEQGSLFHQATCHHRYPFCWRSDTPLIYKAVKTWFVGVEKIKQELLASNAQVHWTPEHIKEGRFGKWLEGARDWAISRNRYWGTPIPIWRAEDGEIIVIGSIAELESLTKTSISDLHRHFIDSLTFEKSGKTFTRIPEVFDCWFESGSMPYAQNHYPFENGALFEKGFPADFIAEGLDQTRGWFYTLTILSTALFQQPAFKNVIVNGIILAENGAKMSKRLKNYPDPMEVVERFGADAIRLYMMHSPAVMGESLCFAESGVELVLRQILLPFWNAYSFFITYARIYQWKSDKEVAVHKPNAVIDRWILSLLNQLIEQVTDGMDRYEISLAVEPLVGFIDQLTNWYIRRSRRRFWEEKQTSDRDQAFATLYEVLIQLSRLAAPFVPFISEAIYQNLKSESCAKSVHLENYPVPNSKMRDLHLETAMNYVQIVVSLGHGLRKEHKIKVRQPLQVAHITSSNSQALEFLKEQSHLIAEELNVKSIHFVKEEEQFVELSPKPNFRVLGKKVGKKMKEVQTAIDQLDQKSLKALLEQGSLLLQLADEQISLTMEDIQIERKVKNSLIAATESAITIALDITLNEELLMEGLARELVNKINTMRREQGMKVTDRIKLSIDTTDKVKECLDKYEEYISQETLLVAIDFNQNQGTEWDLNGEIAKLEIYNLTSLSERK